MTCLACGGHLTCYDTGLSRKLMGRETTEFRCIPCLAALLGTEQAALWRLIRFYQGQGCTLFPQPVPDEIPE